MSVPVTSVNQNNYMVSGQDDIRFPGKILSVKSVSVPICPEPLSDHQFGSGILPPDSGHVEAACLWRMDIHYSDTIHCLATNELFNIDSRLALTGII